MRCIGKVLFIVGDTPNKRIIRGIHKPCRKKAILKCQCGKVFCKRHANNHYHKAYVLWTDIK